jgi:hypothetical protein
VERESLESVLLRRVVSGWPGATSCFFHRPPVHSGLLIFCNPDEVHETIALKSRDFLVIY